MVFGHYTKALVDTQSYGSKYYYSYLNYNGEEYTFKKLIWLNDFLNHPVFINLMGDYRDFLNMFEDKKEKYITKKKDELSDRLKKILKLLNDITSLMQKNEYLITAIKAPMGTPNSLPQRVRTQIQAILITKYSLMQHLNEEFDNTEEIKALINPNENDPFQIKLKTTLLQQVGKTDIFKLLLDFCKIAELTSSQKNLTQKSELIVAIKKLQDSICVLIKGDENSAKAIVRLNEEIETIQGDSAKYLEQITTDDKNRLAQDFDSFNRFFNNILIKFKAPYPETTNPKLQALFDVTSTEKMRELFKLLNTVNKRYFLLEPGSPKIGADLLYTGFSRINTTSYQDVPKYEIYVLADFIGGVINAENRKSIDCKFKDEQVAFETRVAIEKRQQREEEKTPWLLDLDRMFFSVKGSSNQYGIDSFDVVARPVFKSDSNSQPNEKPNPVNAAAPVAAPKPFTQPISNPPKAETPQFDQWLFIEKVINNSETKAAITDVNNKTEYDKTINLLPDPSLLKFIKRTEPEFFAIIEGWNINSYERNEKFLNKMIEYQSRFEGIVKQKEEGLKKINILIDEKRKLEHEILIYKLFIAIVSRMLAVEKGKKFARPGEFGGSFKVYRGKETHTFSADKYIYPTKKVKKRSHKSNRKCNKTKKYRR